MRGHEPRAYTSVHGARAGEHSGRLKGPNTEEGAQHNRDRNSRYFPRRPSTAGRPSCGRMGHIVSTWMWFPGMGWMSTRPDRQGPLLTSGKVMESPACLGPAGQACWPPLSTLHPLPRGGRRLLRFNRGALPTLLLLGRPPCRPPARGDAPCAAHPQVCLLSGRGLLIAFHHTGSEP